MQSMQQYCACIETKRCAVFLFKQKTAYEMRISDWSSDVCSSDLADTPEMVRQCLELLSGRRHDVWSAVAVIDGSGRLRSRNVRSVVAFKQLEPAEIEAYLESGEGVGKAGGYAIQGCAAALIRAMSGKIGRAHV